MDQERRCNEQRNELAPINFPVEGVQLAGVVKREEYKRSEAKRIKVDRPRGVPTPGKNIQADEQVKQAHDSKIIFNGDGLGGRCGDYAGIEGAILAPDFIAGLRPYSQSPEALAYIDGASQGLSVNGDKHIARFDPRAFGRRIRPNEFFRQALLAFVP